MSQTHSRLGIPKTDVYNQYLAYHQGHKGYSNGLYRNKPRLIKVANVTAQNARTFDRQLKNCN